MTLLKYNYCKSYLLYIQAYYLQLYVRILKKVNDIHMNDSII